MTAIDRKHLLLLRVFLVGAAIAWGVSVFGLILPWSTVDAELSKLGAQPINDAMVKYWLKMAAAAYTLLGCFYIMVAIRPAKYKAVIAPIGWLHLVLAAIFLTNGLLLGLGPIPLYIDAAFCACVGLGIIATNNKLQSCFDTAQKKAQ